MAGPTVGDKGEMPEDYIPGGQLEIMMENLQTSITYNSQQIEKMSEKLDRHFESDNKRKEEIKEMLHKIQLGQTEQEGIMNVHSQRLDNHALVLKLAWGFISALALTTLGLILRGILL